MGPDHTYDNDTLMISICKHRREKGQDKYEGYSRNVILPVPGISEDHQTWEAFRLQPMLRIAVETLCTNLVFGLLCAASGIESGKHGASVLADR